MKEQFNPQVDWELFQKLMCNPSIQKMNGYEVCKNLFESTYVTKQMEIFDVYQRLMRSQDVVISKNKEIEILILRVSQLVSRLSRYEDIEKEFMAIAGSVDERAVRAINEEKNEGQQEIGGIFSEGSSNSAEADSTL
jgi:hypothetical protein